MMQPMLCPVHPLAQSIGEKGDRPQEAKGVSPLFGKNSQNAEGNGQVHPEELPSIDGNPIPIEFAGWLPIFEYAGNCGQHPQFKHIKEPPAGYRFTCSRPAVQAKELGPVSRTFTRIGQQLDLVLRFLGLGLRPLGALFRKNPGVGWRDRFRVIVALVRLYITLRRRGAGFLPVVRFLRTRHFQSQLLLARLRSPVFLTSMPFTYGQFPWLVEIEDPTTLFFPMVHNGHTRDLRIAASPYYPIVQTLLESDQCKGILTHMKSTARMVGTLFPSETIRKKIFYTPLGVRVPARWQRHEKEPEHLNLLFINSWCQAPGNFFLRGGLDILEAFARLRKKYPHLRLTMRTNLPGLPPRCHRLMEAGWVRVVHRFLTQREMEDMLAGSHIFLLPAARVHIVSLLQAMSYGLAVVASDGWGISEYLAHERNGLIVPGRYGRVSWADYTEGFLREYYSPMYKPDPRVIRGLVEAISRLVEDPALRRRLGQTARADVENHFNLHTWNQGLKKVFDLALRGGRRDEE